MIGAIVKTNFVSRQWRGSRMIDSKSRIVCQFSCGAASAVATKLAIAQYGATHEVVIINAFLANEHPDNRRFADECAAWFMPTNHGAPRREV
jgi:hypothetical protein